MEFVSFGDDDEVGRRETERVEEAEGCVALNARFWGAVMCRATRLDGKLESWKDYVGGRWLCDGDVHFE
jgi:hypothetical protein